MSRLSEQLDLVDPDWLDHHKSESAAAIFYADELAEMKQPPSRIVGLGSPVQPPEVLPGRYEDWSHDDEC